MWKLVAPEEPPTCRARGPRTLAEWRPRESVDLRADNAVRPGPSNEKERAHHDRDARVRPDKCFDEQDRHESRGDGRDEVSDRFGKETRRPRPASDRRDQHSSEDAGEASDQDDRQGRAGAHQDEAEKVAPKDVRAEREHDPGVVRARVATMLNDEVDRLVRRDALTEEGNDDQ